MFLLTLKRESVVVRRIHFSAVWKTPVPFFVRVRRYENPVLRHGARTIIHIYNTGRKYGQAWNNGKNGKT